MVVLVLIVKFVFDRKTPADIMSLNHDKPEQQSVFVKKYPQADVNNYTTVLFTLGLVLALGLVFSAFKYGIRDKVITMNLDTGIFEDEEPPPPPTFREPPPPPPPPPPEIVVVEDEEIIEDEPEFEVPEIEENDVVEIPEPEPEEDLNENEIFKIVEDQPEFPGGQNALMQYLAKITYPPIAKENDIEGTVYIQFVVEKDGSVSNVTVARSSKDQMLDNAAVSHVKKMPKWTPGKQRGKPVRVQFVVPIRFKLN